MKDGDVKEETPIDKLGLTPTVKRYICERRIDTVEGLLNSSVDDVLSMVNNNIRSAEEITRRLAWFRRSRENIER